MLVAVCSVKGAPGATTTAYALAAAWPSPAVVIEADPLGASLPLRLTTASHARLAETPTVLTLATAARSEGADALARAVQPINDQVAIVPGFLLPERGAGVTDWGPLARVLATVGSPVIVDVGQLHRESAVLSLAAAADVLLPVVRPELESLVRLRDALPLLVRHLAHNRGAAPRVWPVVVSRARAATRDVQDVRRLLAETPANPFVAGTSAMAWDPAAVERLMAGEDPGSWVARSDLMRTARKVTSQLVTDLTNNLTSDPTSDQPASPPDATTGMTDQATPSVHSLLARARRG